MEVELPLINNVKCKTAYANKTNSLIDDKVLCAGFLEGKKDSCRVFDSFDNNRVFITNVFNFLFMNDFRVILEVL